MKVVDEISAIVKMAYVKPSGRPNYRAGADKGVYSDKGNWYESVLGDGSKNYVYLRRPNGGKVPNLAIGTPGRRSMGNVRRLVEDLFKSDLVDKDGTIIGVTPQQAIEEIVSHDNMDSEGGPRRGVLSTVVGPATRWVGSLFTGEKDPAAFTDMRRLPRLSVDGWKVFAKSIPSRAAHKMNYYSVMADERLMSLIGKMRRRLGA